MILIFRHLRLLQCIIEDVLIIIFAKLFFSKMRPNIRFLTLSLPMPPNKCKFHPPFLQRRKNTSSYNFNQRFFSPWKWKVPVKAIFGRFSVFFTGTKSFSRPLFYQILSFFKATFFFHGHVFGFFFTGRKIRFHGQKSENV